ncbi:hypothetical protein K493DRAFT_11093 [Basidiobolus meristosporus CBS 931.73]|uniref:Uncharacterized protein n=1 Tax=Basidiobolus meristosporus CBS 931.73 TaxID=1314790 RepID=A0A1Y1YIU1_9FUNG|nr:hypothetical protein K493DRAFT_11093 [Basidiobolus meristosporus CBS 931.73]|eukprot:ORX97885.1 hypothetical protein K493DRAFT_11093 [Basidiobolus meristosporus CBS 931.73]
MESFSTIPFSINPDRFSNHGLSLLGHLRPWLGPTHKTFPHPLPPQPLPVDCKLKEPFTPSPAQPNPTRPNPHLTSLNLLRVCPSPMAHTHRVPPYVPATSRIHFRLFLHQQKI